MRTPNRTPTAAAGALTNKVWTDETMASSSNRQPSTFMLKDSPADGLQLSELLDGCQPFQLLLQDYQLVVQAPNALNLRITTGPLCQQCFERLINWHTPAMQAPGPWTDAYLQLSDYGRLS